MKHATYIHLPMDYLGCSWFQELDAKEVRLFAAMYTLSRMDKSTPERCLRVGMRRLGKEIGMSHMTAKRTVDKLEKLRVLEIVAEAEGRAPATYRLAEPIELLCTKESSVCVTGSQGNMLHNAPETGSGVTQAVENSADGGKLAPDVTQDEDCVTPSHVNALHLNHSLTGECPSNSPVLGTQRDGACVTPAPPDPIPNENHLPKCPKCGRTMAKTHTFMPGGKRRIWRCFECFEEKAIKDEDLSQPSYSTPSPRAPARAAPPGGQDRALAHED